MMTHDRPAAPAFIRFAPATPTRRVPISRTATHDPRWPAIEAALIRLHDGKRLAVRIVDADCGAGCLLLQAVRHARALGFVAVEGRGIDGSAALIGRARAAAARLRDPAVGLSFEVADAATALREEQDFPADIVLCHGRTFAGADTALDEALAHAGRVVIGDHPLARAA